MRKVVPVFILWLALLAGCAVNPVTGKTEFMTVSTEQEIAMGRQNYVPMQQSQGGAYDTDPELTRYVQGVGASVAAHSPVALPYEFVVLNNSVPNAWALPGGKIAINRGLLVELDSEAELAAVLGHEVTHAAAKHSAQQMSRGMVLQGAVLATVVATHDSDYAQLAQLGAGLGAQLITHKYGRDAEREADYYGMKYMSLSGYDTQGAVDLQKTFVKLSEDRRQDFLSGLFASHPPSQERVQNNIRTLSQYPPGGNDGRKTYKTKIARLKKTRPAYKAYDEGRKALADEDIDAALAKADEALELFAGEANFHALRGDIRFLQDNYDWAATNYDRAIDRRDDFFYYYLQRGLARKELGQSSSAVSDLERSLDLLPTAPAHYALGDIAYDNGENAAAIEHFKIVARSGGEIGQAATARLVQLELPTNPGAYIPSGCSADGSGNLIVSIRNDTTVTVSGVAVAVVFTDASGRQQQPRFNINGRIAPGQVASVDTGLGPYTEGSNCPAKVVAAEIAE